MWDDIDDEGIVAGREIETHWKSCGGFGIDWDRNVFIVEGDGGHVNLEIRIPLSDLVDAGFTLPDKGSSKSNG